MANLWELQPPSPVVYLTYMFLALVFTTGKCSNTPLFSAAPRQNTSFGYPLNSGFLFNILLLSLIFYSTYTLRILTHWLLLSQACWKHVRTREQLSSEGHHAMLSIGHNK